MRVRNVDHARQLLRNAQNDRKDAINSGLDFAEVCAQFDPRISALEETIRNFEYAEDDWQENDGFGFRNRRRR